MSKENVIFSNSPCMWWNVYDTEALHGASVQNHGVWSCWMLAAAFPHRGWPVGSGAPKVCLAHLAAQSSWQWVCKMVGSSLALAGDLSWPGWFIHVSWSRLEMGVSLDSVKLGGSAGLGCVSHKSWAQVGGQQIKVYAAQCLALPIKSLVFVL